MFAMLCAIVALLLLYLSFLFFGLLVQTWYKPCGLCHRPYTKAHVKGFGSTYLHVYACLHLCFMLVLAFLILGFAIALASLCLCGYIRRPWGLVWMQPLGMHCHDAGCFVHSFPLFHFVQWYVCHACLCHPLALYASLHACLHVRAWVLLASVSSMLQHNEVMDIRSKPTFVLCGHHLLFAFFLVCPFACLFAF